MLSSPRRVIQTVLGVLTLVKLLPLLAQTVHLGLAVTIASIFVPSSAMVLLALFIGIVGAVGLILDKIWGFVGCYVFIPLATFGLGSFVLPFPTKLVSSDITVLNVLIITFNFSVLILVVGLHSWGSRERAAQNSGGVV